MKRHLLTLALVLPLAGCATKRDLRDVRDEIAELRAQQVAALQQIQRQNAEILDTLGVQDQRLRGDLQNQAYQIERQLAQLQELTGQGQQRLVEIAERQREQPVRAVPPVGGAAAGEAEELYQAAQEALERGSLGTARAGFEELLRAHPQHPLAAAAQLGIGDSYTLAGEPEEAIEAYGRVLELYPNSEQAPAALLRAATLELDDGDRDRGRTLLNQLVAAYPNSAEAEQARERLRALR